MLRIIYFKKFDSLGSRFRGLTFRFGDKVAGRRVLGTAFRLFVAGATAAAAARRQSQRTTGLAVMAAGRRRELARVRRLLGDAEARRAADAVRIRTLRMQARTRVRNKRSLISFVGQPTI